MFAERNNHDINKQCGAGKMRNVIFISIINSSQETQVILEIGKYLMDI